jgi:hypothetical protein
MKIDLRTVSAFPVFDSSIASDLIDFVQCIAMDTSDGMIDRVKERVMDCM